MLPAKKPPKFEYTPINNWLLIRANVVTGKDKISLTPLMYNDNAPEVPPAYVATASYQTPGDATNGVPKDAPTPAIWTKNWDEYDSVISAAPAPDRIPPN